MKRVFIDERFLSLVLGERCGEESRPTEYSMLAGLVVTGMDTKRPMKLGDERTASFCELELFYFEYLCEEEGT